MKTTSIPHANSCLIDFLPSDPENQRRLAPVFGCLEIGMPELALDLLTSTPEKRMESGWLEALRLLALEQTGASSLALAEEAVHSAYAFPENHQILEASFIHLASSEQYQKLFQLYHTHPQRDLMRRHSSILHNLAAAAAQTGKFKQGLAFAFKSARLNLFSPSSLLIDLQMRPLWEHYATTSFGDLTEARWMCAPSMFRVLDQAINRTRGGLSVCEFTLRRWVPSEFHPWLERDVSSHFVLAAETPQDVRDAYHSWVDDRRVDGVKVFRAAIRNALAYIRSINPSSEVRRGFCYE